MSYITIDTKDFDAFFKGLKELPEAAMLEIMSGLDSAAQVVFVKALEKAPVRTGAIKNSIKKQRAKRKGLYASSAVKLTDTRAIPLELGHRVISHGKIAGVAKERPFLRPAFDESKDEVEKKLVDAFNRAMDKMGG